jgi:hypothetical protein
LEGEANTPRKAKQLHEINYRNTAQAEAEHAAAKVEGNKTSPEEHVYIQAKNWKWKVKVQGRRQGE